MDFGENTLIFFRQPSKSVLGRTILRTSLVTSRPGLFNLTPNPLAATTGQLQFWVSVCEEKSSSSIMAVEEASISIAVSSC
jgi:hypothetical protein